MHIWRVIHFKLSMPRRFHSITHTSFERFLILGGEWKTPTPEEALLLAEEAEKNKRASISDEESISGRGAVEELDLNKQKSVFLSESMNPPKGRVSVFTYKEELYVFGGGANFPKKYELLRDQWKVLNNRGLRDVRLQEVLALPMAYIEL